VEITLLRHKAEGRRQKVEINIYDITGKLLTSNLSLMPSPFAPKARWHAQNQPSGIYLVKVKTGNHELVKRIVLAR
jgi:hypothetical protein